MPIFYKLIVNIFFRALIIKFRNKKIIINYLTTQSYIFSPAQPDCSNTPRFGKFPTLGVCMSSGLGTKKMRSLSTALAEKE